MRYQFFEHCAFIRTSSESICMCRRNVMEVRKIMRFVCYQFLCVSQNMTELAAGYLNFSRPLPLSVVCLCSRNE